MGDYVNIVVHVPNKSGNITILRFVGDAKILHRKQILKRKNRMAKDNNPNNKFKVSPWLVYTAMLIYILLVS
jgi:hypothetical protein